MLNNAKFSWGHPPVAVENMLLFDNMLPMGLHLPAIALDFTKFLIIKKSQLFVLPAEDVLLFLATLSDFLNVFHIRISIYLGCHVAHSMGWNVVSMVKIFITTESCSCIACTACVSEHAQQCS